MKVVNYRLDRIQITCPQCKYEFPYNKRALQNQINSYGQNIKVRMQLLNKLNKGKPPKNKEKIEKVKREIEAYQKKKENLELIRETLRDQEETLILKTLKDTIKEFYGDEAYTRCFDEALRRSAAYDTESMMGLGYYSHAGGKRIRKVS